MSITLASHATQTTATSPPASRTATWTLASFAAPLALISIIAMALVHVVAIGAVDPIDQTMSMYGVHRLSAGLFGLGCTALAAACVALADRLPRVGRWAAYGAALTLVLVVVFPTDVGNGPLSLSAQIHRYAAGTAFALLAILICAVLATSRAASGVLTVLLVIAAVVLALTIIATFAPDFLGISQWRGVPQRVMLLDYALAVALIGARLSDPRAAARHRQGRAAAESHRASRGRSRPAHPGPRPLPGPRSAPARPLAAAGSSLQAAGAVR
ncbi:DUF998 domain-containing protein [Epidermidibacterium keratini]|uniref:DUF998 domain-containing protein n=1 Tax=Epidermidibacterium keratini TaxID=1891644 RepID=A0A7L4YNV1_9ACTN|nr:DUF998 domain-containing protein [Epidermidibacterium keratini]QHC00573.1 DUF998 domain-containing protein [Epidermidibacterium keratini]